MNEQKNYDLTDEQREFLREEGFDENTCICVTAPTCKKPSVKVAVTKLKKEEND